MHLIPRLWVESGMICGGWDRGRRVECETYWWGGFSAVSGVSEVNRLM